MSFWEDIIDDPLNAIIDVAESLSPATFAAETGERLYGDVKDKLNPKTSTPDGSGTSLFEEDLGISIEDQKALAKWQFEQNMANFPKISEAALDNALGTSKDLDAFMSDRFYANLESVLPNWREDILGGSLRQLDAIEAITDDQLRGDVPKDVSDYIIRTRAELGISRGLFGEASTYATARDLGKTSMDIQQMGIQNAVNAVSPLTQRLLTYAQQLQPPVTDPTGIYSAGMGALSGVNLVNVGSVMQMGMQADQFNSEMAWSQAQSQLNYDLMREQMALQQKQYEDAQDAALMNTLIGAGATIAGLALAPATGGLSMAGAGAWTSSMNSNLQQPSQLSSFQLPSNSTSLSYP